MGRLTDIGYGLAGYQYDELSRREKMTLITDAYTDYEYDLDNRLTKLTNHIDQNNSIVFEYANYDKVGNRESCKIDTANAHVYTYDCLYELTLVNYNDGNSTSYHYDKLGSRTTAGGVSYQRNNLNEYTSVGGTNYSYDNTGNLTNDGTNRYYYDCENRLKEVKNLAETQTIATYKYDYRGRRVFKTVGETTTRYLYDGDQAITEYAVYEGEGEVAKLYYYGPGIDWPIMMIAVDGETETQYYYFRDALGSIVALLNNAGNVVEAYSYDPFGKPKVHTAAGTDGKWLTADDTIAGSPVSAYNNCWMFTARQWDTESGLYYYRARMYHPQLGRFLQPDPIGYYDSMNLYTYCLNNPLNWIDPYGLCKDGFPWRDFVREAPKEFMRGAGQGFAAWADGFIPFGDPFSGYYRASDLRFSRAMGGVSRDALLTAAGMKLGGVGSKIGLHGPHHDFPLIGKQPHLQINLWMKGISESGKVIRIPY